MADAKDTKEESVTVPTGHYFKFNGRMVLVGFGAIGTGLLPLIMRHIDMQPSQLTILDEKISPQRREIAKKYGVTNLVEKGITLDNYKTLIPSLLGAGDLMVNVSVDVGCIDVIKVCAEHGILYVDSSVEPWPGTYDNPELSMSERSNYGFREHLLEAKRSMKPNGPTAVVSHGANPGLVSHLVKQALMNIAKDTGLADVEVPTTREGWGKLAQRLGIKAIHVAERDTQVSPIAKKDNEFVNTWSIDGCLGESCQPAELGWGTHEKEFPADGKRHPSGCDAAIYLERPGANTKVRSWTPKSGPFHAWLITHNESVSIADYLTLRGADGKVQYRPTVHFAYHPSNDCVLSIMEYFYRNFQPQEHKRLLLDDISDGRDELGVLLMGHAKGAYWFGSQLSVHTARKLAPYNCATTLQVTASVLGAMVYALKYPNQGVVEPDEMDFRPALEVITPYVYPVVGQYTDWTPLVGRGELFPEDVDKDDPWQFKNIRVV